MFNHYKIRTTQITIYTAAQNEEAAIQIVMEAELCPRSAIKSVRRLKRPPKI
jgi:hypothetical protein